MKVKQSLLFYLKGARLRTLIAIIFPVLIPFLYAHQKNQILWPDNFLPCLSFGVFIQIATNYFNDALDGEKGVDQHRVGEDRIGSDPGDILKMKRAGFITCSFAFIFGLPVVIQLPELAPFMLLGLFLSYGYTGGPYPLAYNGLGELFVFLFFGFVATNMTYYAVTEVFELNILFFSVFLGIDSTLIIAMNNFRDVEDDALHGKRTLAVILGREKFFTLTLFLLFISLLLKSLFLILVQDQIVFIFPFALVLFLFSIVLLKSKNKGKEHRSQAFKWSLVHFVSNSFLILWFIYA